MKHIQFSNIGFLLVATGSAVGLGNIWKFPYISGIYGGGAFVLIYLATVALIGFSVLIAEMAIGSLGKKDAVSSFESLNPNKNSIFKYSGFMAFNGVLILTFYMVVIGWILSYIFSVSFFLPSTLEEAQILFDYTTKENIFSTTLFFIAGILITAYIVNKGIKSGIERFNKIFLPILVLIFVVLFFYAITLDGFGDAFKFLFYPDWSKISTEALMMAIGHAFFTLSLGMGAILAYASSVPAHANIFKASFVVVIFDTLIALLAGLVIFTFLFEFNSEPARGPGLVFISLPTIFYKLGFMGNIFALMFFVALVLAGLTSSVSLLEPTVQYLMDRKSYTRSKAVFTSSSFVFIVGFLVLLSTTTMYGDFLTFFGKSLFDLIDFTTSAILLPVSGFLIAMFVGFIIPSDKIKSYLLPQMGEFFFGIWMFSLKYIAPFGLGLLLAHESGLLELLQLNFK